MTFALVAAAAVGLPVAALAKPPNAPTVAGYLEAHVPAGTRIGVVPDVTARIPDAYPTVPIKNVNGLVAAQPHWMVVGKGGDEVTAWTVSHGVLRLSTSKGRLYSVDPPARSGSVHLAIPPRTVRASPLSAQRTGGRKMTVAQGDTFWGIAERVAATRAGGIPTGPEIAAVCRALIVANSSRLTHPGNPNLLFVGQVLDVPPP